MKHELEWLVNLTYSRPRGRDVRSLVDDLVRHLEPYEPVMTLAPDRIVVSMTVYGRIEPVAALACAAGAIEDAPDGLSAARIKRAEVMAASAALAVGQSGVHVVEVAHRDLVAELREVLAQEGLTVDEFIRRGRSDALRGDRLRDLWLRIGPAVR